MVFAAGEDGELPVPQILERLDQRWLVNILITILAVHIEVHRVISRRMRRRVRRSWTKKARAHDERGVFVEV